MRRKIKDIYSTTGQTVTIYGLSETLGIDDGSAMTVVWINTTHVELKSDSGFRICLRTWIAEDVMYHYTEPFLL